MQDVAHPEDSDCKRFDSNIVLAPQRCTYVIEGTFRTAESAGQIPGQRMEGMMPPPQMPFTQSSRIDPPT